MKAFAVNDFRFLNPYLTKKRIITHNSF